MKKKHFLLPLLMAIVMMAMSPQRLWAENLEVSSNVTISSDATYDVVYVISGTLTIKEGVTVTCNVLGNNNGTLIIEEGATVTCSSNFNNYTGKTFNYGTINAGGLNVNSGNCFANHGVINGNMGTSNNWYNTGTVNGDYDKRYIVQCYHNERETLAYNVTATCKHGGGTKARCNACGYISYTKPVADHTLTAHNAVTATCTTAGSIAYWSCSVCDKYFSDLIRYNEIAASSVVIPATGIHSYCTTGTCTVCEAAVPNNMIIYTASAQLDEATETWNPGLHTNAFDEVTISSHTFENGVGTITFSGDLTSIGDYAFNQCSTITGISIPSSVTSIGENAFYGCKNITGITIPSSVTSIGNYAFSNCYMTSSNLHNSSTIDLTQKGLTIIDTEQADGLLIKDNCAVKCRPGATSVTIPSSVTSIGEYAFSNCSNLASITFTTPSSVTSIGQSAFSGCTNLATITIPGSVASIGNYAFNGCSNLTSVNFSTPCSLTTIASQTFGSCTNLTSITIPNSVTNINANAFSGCTNLATITIPASVTSIGNKAFDNTAWYNAQPDGLVYAGCVAYKYKGTMPENTAIELKADTKGIASAFEDCSNLTSITIPEGVTNISSGAFRNCTGLTSITIPGSMVTIGIDAFFGCSGLTSVNISTPSSLTKIGDTAFRACMGITSITIPGSVTSIGDRAFWECGSLKSVICESTTPASLSSDAFKYYNDGYQILSNLQAIYVPASSVDTYKSATNWSDYAEKIKTVPVTVTSGSTTSGYATFPEALAAAADGSTITLYEDVTVIESANKIAITIGANKFPNGLTLNLNSHGITIENTTGTSQPSFLINKENKVTIKNGELIVKNYGFAVSCMSPLTLESVKIDGSQLSYLASMKLSAIYCGADLTCKDCVIKARHEGERALSVTNGIATLTGTTTVEGNIHLSNNTLRAASTVTISKCTLETGTGYDQIGALSIANGTFTAPTGFAWSAVGSDGLSTLYSSALSLNDEKDPTSTLQALVAANAAQNLTLTGRTLYKDGYYNTLCLPFALTAAELAASPLAGCTLKEVSGASLNTETNTMTIQLIEVNALEAGKPYLIKWAAASENIENPTFTGVTITKSEPNTITGDNLDVVGIFAPQLMKSSDTDIFFLGAENKFYTSDQEYGSNLKGYRCYFKQKSSNSAKALNFVLDDETTGISQIENGKLRIENCKIIENGKVVIIRNGQKYNVNGQVIK